MSWDLNKGSITYIIIIIKICVIFMNVALVNISMWLFTVKSN